MRRLAPIVTLHLITALAILTTLASLVIGSVARAQEEGPWWSWPTIDGNWGGYRDLLADHGLVLSGTSVSDFQGNVSGGEKRGVAGANSSLFSADANLEELA